MERAPNSANNKIPWPVVNEQYLGENAAPGKRIKVRCINPEGLYYRYNRFRENDVFYLIPTYVTVLDKMGSPVIENGAPKRQIKTAEDQFVARIMEKVDEDAPTKLTGAQQALNQKTEEINAEKRGPGRPRKDQSDA